jgi:hypothetical protein
MKITLSLFVHSLWPNVILQIGAQFSARGDRHSLKRSRYKVKTRFSTLASAREGRIGKAHGGASPQTTIRISRPARFRPTVGVEDVDGPRQSIDLVDNDDLNLAGLDLEFAYR